MLPENCGLAILHKNCFLPCALLFIWLFYLVLFTHFTLYPTCTPSLYCTCILLVLFYLVLFTCSFCVQREQPSFFSLSLYRDQLFFRFIAFEWFHILGIFGYFLTLMEMTSLMTGFILNGLSESLLSSRLFRIKAWVLQVPFLSMIFLYFFDYSNLNHSKVFYLFLFTISFSFWIFQF